MREQDVEMKLRQALQSPAGMGGEHYESTLMLAREEACKRQRRVRISFTAFLSGQIRFIGWKIWGMQGIFLLAVSFIVSHVFGVVITPCYLTKQLLCLSVLVFMTALPLLYRSVRWQMQEVEAASRFSSVKLLTARLIVIGIGDICMLGCIFAATILKTSLGADRAMLYLCVPFLLVCGSCLFMLGHFTPKAFLRGSVGLCSFLLLLFALFPDHWGIWLQQSFSAGWIGICILLLGFCAQQFRYIVHASPYTERQMA